MRAILVALALCMCTGCWVLDELDSGSELLDQHSGKRVEKEKAKAAAKANGGKAPGAAPGAPQPPPGKTDPGILHELVVWTKKKLEGPPPPPDPLDMSVICTNGKSTMFTTRGECEARGGVAKDLPPEH